MFASVIDTLSRIALENALLLAPLLALVALLVSHYLWGGWPDLWRARRAVLPFVDRLADGDDDEQLDVVDDHTTIDVSGLAAELPEKTGLPLQEREFAGVLDASPAEVRQEFRSMLRWCPCWLASIQYELVDGKRTYEVGSYAFRAEGLLDERQVHVRLTPRDNGRKTALWTRDILARPKGGLPTREASRRWRFQD